MKFIKGFAVLVTSLGLVACGGGKGTPTTTSTAARVEVLASQTTAGTGGDEVTITAFVKDDANNALSDTAVAFSTNTGTLTNISTTTGTSGAATATFSPGNDHSNRTATITVTSGSISGSVNVTVQGTKLSISGGTTVSLSTTTPLTLSAVDSKGNPISGVALSVTSTLGNGLSASSVTTDSNGQAIVSYTALNSGSDSLSVSGAGASATQTVTVSGEDFTFVSPAANTAVAVRNSQNLTVLYRKNGVPQSGVTVSFAATVGTLTASSAVTDATGQASVSISSNFAAGSTVSAMLPSNTGQATLPLSFVATTPSKLVLQISPTALAPNPAGTSSNQASVIATVTDADGNPVKDATVNFSQVADPSGGQLQQASTVTDSSGQASVKYQSGPLSTASGGVVLKATYAGNSAVTNTAKLTVNQTAVFIALGTGNTVGTPDPDTYEKTWTATVTDTNGVRVVGIPLTVKIIPTYYRKGFLAWNGTFWAVAASLSCQNEDYLNTNGILDPGEDINGDGMLTPGNVVALQSSTVKTDSNGQATITFRYAESFASWVSVRLTATAVVSGTESVSYRDFPLDVLADDYNVETKAPAGRLSPFGIDTSTCTNPN